MKHDGQAVLVGEQELAFENNKLLCQICFVPIEVKTNLADSDIVCLWLLQLPLDQSEFSLVVDGDGSRVQTCHRIADTRIAVNHLT